MLFLNLHSGSGWISSIFYTSILIRFNDISHWSRQIFSFCSVNGEGDSTAYEASSQSSWRETMVEERKEVLERKNTREFICFLIKR